jgi:hypothetical protein
MLSNWHIADPIAARSIPIESNESKLACVASPEKMQQPFNDHLFISALTG